MNSIYNVLTEELFKSRCFQYVGVLFDFKRKFYVVQRIK